jgi:hypothetical protein
MNTAHSDKVSYLHSAYMYEFFMWLKLFGELLRHQATAAIVRDFLLRINKNGEAEVSDPNYGKFCASFNTLNKLECDLSLYRTKSIQISNPYAGKSMGNVDSGSQNIVSGESLSAIEEYGNYIMSSAAMPEKM